MFYIFLHHSGTLSVPFSLVRNNCFLYPMTSGSQRSTPLLLQYCGLQTVQCVESQGRGCQPRQHRHQGWDHTEDKQMKIFFQLELLRKMKFGSALTQVVGGNIAMKQIHHTPIYDVFILFSSVLPYPKITPHSTLC